MRFLDLAPDTDSTTSIAPPEGFDARRFPVIAVHFFGAAPPWPWEPLAAPLARVIARLPVVDEPEDEAA